MKQTSGPTKKVPAEAVLKDTRREANALTEVGDDLTLENRLLKTHERGWDDDT